MFSVLRAEGNLQVNEDYETKYTVLRGHHVDDNSTPNTGLECERM